MFKTVCSEKIFKTDILTNVNKIRANTTCDKNRVSIFKVHEGNEEIKNKKKVPGMGFLWVTKHPE